jgi:hypothetical protein
VIDLLALGLFRRHVRHRAENLTASRQLLGRQGGESAWTYGRLGKPGEPEVQHLQPAIGRDHHVDRLQIAVRDAARMRPRHRVG